MTNLQRRLGPAALCTVFFGSAFVPGAASGVPAVPDPARLACIEAASAGRLLIPALTSAAEPRRESVARAAASCRIMHKHVGGSPPSRRSVPIDMQSGGVHIERDPEQAPRNV
eukprot:CAMPEP_0175725890 /NCGR_PEP_ID=MMETSP0097-20121207/47990_1 /TAXON_ID=311494 /ORGANISM="Alexandrium monilatum, Strain CCMP3105" /LENGTH=112 /DNA_ID=CAMNT_0017033673 /DNA_START=24 /DNA_END=359 /DNA_ORIENTATION=-